MPAALQPLVITSDSKSLHTAILDSAAFLRSGYRGFLKLLKRGCLVHIYINIYSKRRGYFFLKEIPQDYSDGDDGGGEEGGEAQRLVEGGERMEGGGVGGVEDDVLSFCLHGAAQGCRGSETKHDASEAEGPSSKAKRGGKRVESLREREGGQGGGGGEGGGREEGREGGGGKLRTHRFALKSD